MNRIIIIILSFILLFIISCDNGVEFNNPVDTSNPNYSVPTVTISMTETVENNQDAIKIHWEGNLDTSWMMFSYKLNNSSWSVPTTANSIILDNLDDTPPDYLLHKFFVKGIYNNDVEDYLHGDILSQDSISFSIDAVASSSFRVAPIYQEVISTSEPISVEIVAEDVSNVRYFECIIEFESTYLEYNTYLSTNGEEGSFNSEVLFIDVINENSISINGGIFTPLNTDSDNPIYFTGWGSIVKLFFNQ